MSLTRKLKSDTVESLVTHDSLARRAGMGRTREIIERNRDALLQDEARCGVAFIDSIGNRVDPEKVFKSVANTYTDYRGHTVTLWHSEAEAT